MKKILFLLFLTGCSTGNTNTVSSNKIFDFNNDLTFNEYKSLLKEYSKIKEFPDID